MTGSFKLKAIISLTLLFAALNAVFINMANVNENTTVLLAKVEPHRPRLESLNCPTSSWVDRASGGTQIRNNVFTNTGNMGFDDENPCWRSKTQSKAFRNAFD